MSYKFFVIIITTMSIEKYNFIFILMAGKEFCVPFHIKSYSITQCMLCVYADFRWEEFALVYSSFDMIHELLDY